MRAEPKRQCSRTFHIPISQALCVPPGVTGKWLTSEGDAVDGQNLARTRRAEAGLLTVAM